jgi:hypothetical protein
LGFKQNTLATHQQQIVLRANGQHSFDELLPVLFISQVGAKVKTFDEFDARIKTEPTIA